MTPHIVSHEAHPPTGALWESCGSCFVGVLGMVAISMVTTAVLVPFQLYSQLRISVYIADLQHTVDPDTCICHIAKYRGLHIAIFQTW